MHCSTEELFARFSSKELTRWMCYETVEPFGERAADDRFALLTWSLFQLWCTKNTLKIEDFKHHFRETPVQSSQEMAEILKGLAQR